LIKELLFDNFEIVPLRYTNLLVPSLRVMLTLGKVAFCKAVQVEFGRQ
jgi:hypothetical protein